MNHCLLRLQHAFVHIDVDDLGTVLYLLPGDLQCLFIFAFLDQAFEASRAGYIGTFTNVDE